MLPQKAGQILKDFVTLPLEEAFLYRVISKAKGLLEEEKEQEKKDSVEESGSDDGSASGEEFDEGPEEKKLRKDLEKFKKLGQNIRERLLRKAVEQDLILHESQDLQVIIEWVGKECWTDNGSMSDEALSIVKTMQDEGRLRFDIEEKEDGRKFAILYRAAQEGREERLREEILKDMEEDEEGRTYCDLGYLLDWLSKAEDRWPRRFAVFEIDEAKSIAMKMSEEKLVAFEVVRSRSVEAPGIEDERYILWPRV